MVIVIITIQNEYSQPGGITDSFAHIYKKYMYAHSQMWLGGE